MPVAILAKHTIALRLFSSNFITNGRWNHLRYFIRDISCRDGSHANSERSQWYLVCDKL